MATTTTTGSVRSATKRKTTASGAWVSPASGHQRARATKVVTTLARGSAPRLRIAKLRKGLSPKMIGECAELLGWTTARLLAALNLPKSSVSRKLREDKPLDPAASERLLAIIDLISQVESMVERSGRPEGFDAARWISTWLETENSALGGDKPADYLDTATGAQVVSQLLAQMESGAYA